MPSPSGAEFSIAGIRTDPTTTSIASMHEYTKKMLMEAFGPPARTREQCHWWEIPQPDQPPLFLCLDAPMRPQAAHLLMFNPSPKQDPVVDVSAYNEEEARRLVKGILKTVGRDGGGQAGREP